MGLSHNSEPTSSVLTHEQKLGSVAFNFRGWFEFYEIYSINSISPPD